MVRRYHHLVPKQSQFLDAILKNMLVAASFTGPFFKNLVLEILSERVGGVAVLASLEKGGGC